MAPAPSPHALLSIGQVEAATGIAQHVLRYWEARLPQLQPVKRAGGRRYYRPEDVAMIRDVQRLIDTEGFTLDGAARALRRGGAVGAAGTAVSDTVTVPGDMVPALRALRDRLARALR